MNSDEIVILSGNDVLSLLAGREREIMHTVQLAYEAHAKGRSSLPHSTFLTFPGEPANRIIALPAFLGDEFQVAGMKWIASFPGNRDAGLDRASAVVILNSTSTGRPQAVIEGSVVSAKRTAASAALAARVLHSGQESSCIGLIGCGLINLEVALFLRASQPDARRLLIFDLSRDRAHQFKAKANELLPELDIDVASDVTQVLRECSLISLATTAIEPHIFDLSLCPPGSTILHVSLRDLSPQVILGCDNIVDDIDHVCRARTSVHLAELQVGNRDFIRGTLADVLTGKPSRSTAESRVIFSPFGLGILDMAVGKLVCDLARTEGRGQIINSFLPAPWTERTVAREPYEVKAPV